MFRILGIAVVLLGAIPLFRLVAKGDGIPRGAWRRKLPAAVAVLLAAILLVAGLGVFFALYTEYLWFESVGFPARFWTVLRTQIFLSAGAILAVFVALAAVTAQSLRGAQRRERWAVFLIAAVVAFILGLPAGQLWEPFLLFVHHPASELSDPVLGKSVSFYLFRLPFYTQLISWLYLVLIAGVIFAGAAGMAGWTRAQQRGAPPEGPGPQQRLFRAPLVVGGLLLLVLAWDSYLGVYRLLYSEWGAVTGAGYTDVHYRTLGYYASVLVYAAIGVALLASAASGRVRTWFARLDTTGPRPQVKVRPAAWAGAVGAVVLLLVFRGLIPLVVMTFYVAPNEITVEKPYIEHNIRFTRLAFGIDSAHVSTREYSLGPHITEDVTEKNRPTLNNVRLWDPRALLDNLREQQEIRLYYQFQDVDIDRYVIEDEYRQVMLAVRELEKGALDPRSQTWVSRQFKYTHGYGLVLLPVHEFLSQGKPKLLVRNIPPESAAPRLQVRRPEIYYGENTTDHVYVDTKEKEFDYPAGETNEYTSYAGQGGVTLDSFLKELAFAWKFDGHRLLFSGYVTRDSRVLFRRRIQDRVAAIAPFLEFDEDPYPVLTPDGRVQYIVDAYTTSRAFPYSDPYRGVVRKFHGVNYIRNSVKAVVDAYEGTVRFYVINAEDLLLRAYRRMFPDMFLPLSEMPPHIRRHIRVPQDLFFLQAEIYGTYHMQDPEVFYQREDVWALATERYRETFQYVMPYYVMVQLPEGEGPEFVLMTPFTPKNKNVMRAWLAARCDGEHYGELVVFTFPKGTEVLGPRQIEARIDQDTEMSRAMTLWGQRGSSVIRGNLLAIPLFDEDKLFLLYAEPIYIQAEDARLPEVKRVALADQTRVVWDEDFETALNRLLGRPEAEARPEQRAAPALGDLPRQALEHFRAFQQAVGDGEFERAGAELEAARRVLSEMTREQGEAGQ